MWKVTRHRGLVKSWSLGKAASRHSLGMGSCISGLDCQGFGVDYYCCTRPRLEAGNHALALAGRWWWWRYQAPTSVVLSTAEAMDCCGSMLSLLYHGGFDLATAEAAELRNPYNTGLLVKFLFPLFSSVLPQLFLKIRRCLSSCLWVSALVLICCLVELLTEQWGQERDGKQTDEDLWDKAKEIFLMDHSFRDFSPYLLCFIALGVIVGQRSQ